MSNFSENMSSQRQKQISQNKADDPVSASEFRTCQYLERSLSLGLCTLVFWWHLLFNMEFLFLTIVILMIIFILLCSTTRQCELQINKHSLNTHGAPGAAATMGIDVAEVHGEINDLIYISHLVSTFALYKHSAHLHNLLVE